MVVCSGSHEKKVNLGEVFPRREIRIPARNIMVVCSGSHEKKVNLGEVFPGFDHPVTGEPLHFSSELPPAFEAELQRLRRG